MMDECTCSRALGTLKRGPLKSDGCGVLWKWHCESSPAVDTYDEGDLAQDCSGHYKSDITKVVLLSVWHDEGNLAQELFGALSK